MAHKRVVTADQVLNDVLALALALAKLHDNLELHRLALLGAAHEATKRLGFGGSDLADAMDPISQSVLDLEERADDLTVLASSIGRRLTRRTRPLRPDDGVTWLRRQLDGLRDGGAAS